MRKVISVKIIKNSLIFFVFLMYTVSSTGQNYEIQSIDDYSILNKSIERYFYSRAINDSLFFNSDLYKENSENKEVIRAVKMRKKLDTLYIELTSDKINYERFLKNDARWKREKWFKKFKPYLDSIFSEKEVTNYKKQLEDNNYFWSENKIDFKDHVFVINELVHSRKEISEMSQTKKDSLLRENSKLTKHKNVYTFSKPIFSIDKNIGLIAYSNIANNVLLIYEKKDNNWYFKHLLSENYFIDKIERL